MRLSEAIRLGSMLKPQCEGSLREDGKTCALGAACDAVGIPFLSDEDCLYHALENEFPQLNKAARCPACSFLVGMFRRWREKEFDLEDVIVHLNDDHQWKRERIADWLAGLEPLDLPQEPKSASAPTFIRNRTVIG